MMQFQFTAGGYDFYQGTHDGAGFWNCVHSGAPAPRHSGGGYGRVTSLAKLKNVPAHLIPPEWRD